jgi:hypothetical protein
MDNCARGESFYSMGLRVSHDWQPAKEPSNRAVETRRTETRLSRPCPDKIRALSATRAFGTIAPNSSATQKRYMRRAT